MQLSLFLDIDEQIIEAVRRDTSISTRRLAYRLNVSHAHVWRVLRSNHLHPYHLTPVQGLHPGDNENRLAFARFMLRMDDISPAYISSILWTDESCFTKDGVTNFHNLHNWNEMNLRAIRQRAFQRRFSVNVWAGIVDNTLIGPYILPPVLNGRNYLQFLIELDLEDLPLAVRRRLIFQHDGAPAHISRYVREFLNQQYPRRWIRRNGPIVWPPRSPDMTPLDFYLWGAMKALVYEVEIETREQLIERINEAAIAIRHNMRTFDMSRSIRHRLELCVIHNGGHFENYL